MFTGWGYRWGQIGLKYSHLVTDVGKHRPRDVQEKNLMMLCIWRSENRSMNTR